MFKLGSRVLPLFLWALVACHAGPTYLPDSLDEDSSKLPTPSPTLSPSPLPSPTITPSPTASPNSSVTPEPNFNPEPNPPPESSPLPSGAVTTALDNHFFVGSMSEDSPQDLNFWREYAANPHTTAQIPARYIYITGGFSGGWRTWGATDGDRANRYIRNSFALGTMPVFIYYQIPPGGGESYSGDLSNMQSESHMKAYFLDLKFFLDIVRTEGGDKKVGIILEPDFLGYMMQNNQMRPSQLMAATSAAYLSGVLDQSDPSFPNTLQGLVTAINYTIRKYAPNALFGWQVNLWASSGIHHRIPVNGICRITDTMGISAGRLAVQDEAKEIALYYKEAGILEYNPKWIFIDKYGLDGAGNFCSDPLNNPSGCIWFWNSDHWNNYIAFIETLHQTLQKPIVLWQIPLGHLNESFATNPITEQTFPLLTNTARNFEDTAPIFILGDVFKVSTSERLLYFGDVQDPKTTKNDDIITIKSHVPEFIQAGAVGVLFGAGVGLSTDFDTDGGWWITKVQDYYRNGPIPLRPQ